MITYETYKKFRDIVWKVESHPAFTNIFTFAERLDHSLEAVCKRGLCEFVAKGGVDIWYNKENYKRYKSLFDEKMKDLPKHEKPLTRITIPYEDYYGEPWKYDHVEYWGEFGFNAFLGMDFSKSYHRDYWDTYYCMEFNCSALTYEDLVIKIGTKFLETYGNLTEDDFLTNKEKEAKNKRLNKLINSIKNHELKVTFAQPNPERISVAEINRRWFEAFIQTKNGKNYADDLKRVKEWKMLKNVH